jgi:hypothetical protein
MKKAIKHLYFIYTALSLSLIATDYKMFSSIFPSDYYNSPIECADMAKHSGSFHSDSPEHEVCTNELHDKFINLHMGVKIISLSDVSYKNDFTSSIWQPPKFS